MNFKQIRPNSPYSVSYDGRIVEGMRNVSPRYEPETGLPFIYYSNPEGRLEKMYLHVAVYRCWSGEPGRETAGLTKDQIKFADPGLRFPALCALSNLKPDNSEQPGPTIATRYVSDEQAEATTNDQDTTTTTETTEEAGENDAGQPGPQPEVSEAAEESSSDSGQQSLEPADAGQPEEGAAGSSKTSSGDNKKKGGKKKS